MSRRRIAFEQLALLGAALFVVFLISRYDLCFQDSELYDYDRAAVADGLGLSLNDLPAALHVLDFEGDIRPRFISYFTFIVATKTRLALWRLIPPHPSFSPVWLLTLFVSPVLLFKFLESELEDRGAAMAGVAVYLVSTGFLSGITMLFHPAKPLTNVLVIAVFYLSARVRREWPGRAWSGSHAALLALLTMAPFVDETAVFAYVIPLVWCPALLRRKATYIPAIVSAALIFGILPMFPAVAGTPRFLVAGYLLRAARAGIATGGWRFDLRHVLWNAGSMLIPPLLPWTLAHAGAPVESRLTLPIAALTGLAVLFAVLTWTVSRIGACWPFYRKLAILVAGFVGFETLVLVFHPQQLVPNGFYYGAIFSVMFSALAGASFATLRRSTRGAWIAYAGLVWVMTLSAHNFMTINESWRRHSNGKVLDDLESTPGYHTTGDWRELDGLVGRDAEAADSPLHAIYMQDQARRSPSEEFREVVTIWRAWRQGTPDFVGGRMVTQGNAWLVAELSLKNERRR